MHLTKQKIVTHAKFDAEFESFKRGSHMPLMIFVGNPGCTRRTKHSQQRLRKRAEQRGWGKEARERKAKARKVARKVMGLARLAVAGGRKVAKGGKNDGKTGYIQIYSWDDRTWATSVAQANDTSYLKLVW